MSVEKGKQLHIQPKTLLLLGSELVFLLGIVTLVVFLLQQGGTDTSDKQASFTTGNSSGFQRYTNGQALEKEGRHDEAIAQYSEAIRRELTYVQAYYARASLLGVKSDFDGAIGDYNMALLLNPNDGFALINRGRTYMFKGEYSKAIEDFRRAIRHQPDDVWAHSNLGIAYGYLGDYDQAFSTFDQALAIGRDAASVYLSRGEVHARKGDKTKARADLNLAINLSSEDWIIRRAEDLLRSLEGN